MDEQDLRPRIIEIPSIGRKDVGYVNIAEQCGGFPFQINRVFWISDVPTDLIRGRHTHYELEQVLVAVAGTVLVATEDKDGEEKEFELRRPDRGLYLPPLCWHTMKFLEGSALLSLASTEYREDDYIRDYQKFKESRRG